MVTGPVNSAETSAYSHPQLIVAHGLATFTARANTERRSVPGSPPVPNVSAVINSDDHQAATVSWSGPATSRRG